MEARMLHDHQAVRIDLDISQEDQTATFHFLEENGDVRVLTTPLFELADLHRRIAARLVAEPELFSPLKRGRNSK